MHPKDNIESWQQIHKLVDEFPDDDYSSKWKPMVHNFVSALEARGLSSSIRVGQSMYHIILSTQDYHRLISEPRVTLDFHPKEKTVRIAYSCANLYFNEPLAQETVPISAALPSTLAYLRRLWSETKLGIATPNALNEF